MRFDQERQPPYDPRRFLTVEFGWGDKIAPRIGGAYDALHNGKLKVFASYGKFYDIMKMGLARGSFGSDRRPPRLMGRAVAVRQPVRRQELV